MNETVSITLIAFLMASSLSLLVSTLVGGRKTRLDLRLRGLADAGHAPLERETVEQFARSALPRLGTPLVPTDEDERTLLQARLMHAGLYGRQAMRAFLGAKIVLIVVPLAAGLFVGVAGLAPFAASVIGGSILGMVGMIGPSFWLDRRKAARQLEIRRALPDALDILVICLEGGLSLPASLRYVAEDLRTAHPLLATELNIVQREVHLGLTTGESLRRLGGRADLDEIGSLASVVIQADRLGASLVRSLRIHADMMRIKRRQRAEEMAQKAATKILFPTILFIFPALFVVILAPGLLQVVGMFKLIKPH
jgi:tight adherence protein C